MIQANIIYGGSAGGGKQAGQLVGLQRDIAKLQAEIKVLSDEWDSLDNQGVSTIALSQELVIKQGLLAGKLRILQSYKSLHVDGH